MPVQQVADAAGVRLIAYDTLGSTNAEALALARAGEHGPLWVTAKRQTAGRGRRGNAWVSEAGNLFASLLLTDGVPPGCAAELCFVAALALRDAVSPLIPPLKGEGRIAEGNPGWGHSSEDTTPTRRALPVDLPLAVEGEERAERLKLKWPNDLLIDGRKFSGILIEAETTQARVAVAIGIGVNCAHHPDDAARPATDLAACGIAVEPDALLRSLSAAMTQRLAQWDSGAGFPGIRSDWLEHAAGIGGDIRVRLPDRELTGQFETLDRMGRLMLRLPGGALEAITVGEVFAPNLTPTRRASLADLPLSGGGMKDQ